MQAELKDKEHARLQIQQEIAQAESDVRKEALLVRSDQSGIEREISATQRQLAENEAQGEELIVAPVDGVVTSLLATEGQEIADVRPLAVLIPPQARLEAQLCVPERAVPQLAVGGRIALRYRSFPYQSFGQQQAVIRQIDETAVAAADSDCPAAPGQNFYRAVGTLPDSVFGRAGRVVELRPGMQFDTTVTVRRMSVLQMLLRTA
jgi:membrane fusion protein